MNPEQNTTLLRLKSFTEKIVWTRCPECNQDVSRLCESGLCWECHEKRNTKDAKAMKDWGIVPAKIVPPIKQDKKTKAYEPDEIVIDDEIGGNYDL